MIVPRRKREKEKIVKLQQNNGIILLQKAEIPEIVKYRIDFYKDTL